MAERTAGAPELAELSDEFHVVAEIGRGGTAVVYLAHELALDRRVAIKIIRGRYAGDDELVARLEREARLVARLAHPNVVGLHAVRRLRHGSLALVMQYVDGHTLRDELRRRGALPAARARRVLTDVARALAAAHAHGIVHRDVKPENIHLDHETGRVLLGDFGSATPLDPDSRLTIPGMTIGTPGYMAPELVDGGTATPASDLYSLGLVGWEMLAGQPPWSGTTLFEVLAFRKHGQLAPIDAVRPDVPRSLARAIERAMQGEPAARWDSAAAMATALGGATDRPDAGDALPLDLRPGAAPPARYGDGAPDAPPDLPTLRFVRSTEQRSEEPVAAAAAALPLPLPTGGDPPGAIEAPPSLADAVGADAGEGDAVDEPPDVSSWAAPAGPTSGGAWRRALRPAAVLTVLAGTAAAAALLVNLGRSAPPVGPLATGSDVPPRHEVPVGDVPAPPAGRPSGVATPTAPADPGATTAPAALATGPSGAATADSAPEPADSLLTAAAEHAGSLASVPDPAPRTTPSVREEATPPATSPTAPATRSSAPATPQVGPGPELVRERAGRLASVPPPAIDRTAPVAPRGRPSPANASESGETAGAIVARTVSAGGMHSCAVLPGSQVRCWGSNDHGQLGSRGAARQVRATPIVAGLELHGLALGLAHSCGLTDDGTALCWGDNDRGQLGIGAVDETAVPSRVAGGTHFTALAVGAAHSCGLDGDGRALCWGSNDDGQLGTGDADDHRAPTPVAGVIRFRGLAAGWNHTCAIATSGRAFCWGSNDDGQLGVGGGSRDTPTPVGTAERVRALAAGSAHSCALTEGGDVLCWGRNREGQLGDGTRTSARVPHRVELPGAAVAVAAGTVHSCALLRTDEVYCWGQNRYGQLGDGTTIDRATPVRVATTLPFAAIAASGAHSCGVTTDGATLCWGYNLDGQLGDGTRDNRTRPVPVRAGGGG